MKTALLRRPVILAAALLLAGSPVALAQFGAPVVGGARTTAAAVLPTAALDAANMVGAINVAAFEQRERVLDDAEARVDRAGEAVGVLNNKSLGFDSTTLQFFKEALNVARLGDDALRKSITAARDATAVQWNDARAALTAAYTAYADALVKLEAAMGPAYTDTIPLSPAPSSPTPALPAL